MKWKVGTVISTTLDFEYLTNREVGKEIKDVPPYIVNAWHNICSVWRDDSGSGV